MVFEVPNVQKKGLQWAIYVAIYMIDIQGVDLAHERKERHWSRFCYARELEEIWAQENLFHIFAEVSNNEGLANDRATEVDNEDESKKTEISQSRELSCQRKREHYQGL